LYEKYSLDTKFCTLTLAGDMEWTDVLTYTNVSGGSLILFSRELPPAHRFQRLASGKGHRKQHDKKEY
jgi:hypothetical protein